MGTTLTGTTPQDTYDALIKVGDNGPISETAKVLTDGLGNDSALSLSTTAVGIGINAPTTRLHVRGSGATAATTALQIENSAGTAALTVNDAGTVNIPRLQSFGYSASVQRLAINNGVSTILAYLLAASNGVLRFANLTENDFDRLQFGGGTASFPAFKKVSNNLEVRNADDTFGAGFSVGAGLNASAILQADSTIKGFLPPRMTTAQRDAIVSPATGLKIYNTTLDTTDTYDGATWQRVGKQTLIKGSGATSATTALRVENSAAALGMRVRDDGQVQLGQSSNFTVDGTTTFNRYELVVGALSSIPSAILSATSTTRGFLTTRMTTAQKNAIASPAAGLMVYDTDTNKLCCYNGTTWNDLF